MGGGALSSPVVSICCITFNHEAYIKDTLNGFLIQETDFPFEILIHDDASIDGTANIIREYVKEYPSLIKPIYQSENQYSRSKKINPEFNFSRAMGNYIALCEGDDYWVDSNKLRIQKQFLDQNPGYVICYTDAMAITEDGTDISEQYPAVRDDLAADELQKCPSIYTLTTMFRNLIPTNPPELGIAKYGDLTMWSRLGEFGKGKFLDQIKPSIYRVHQAGLHSMQSRYRQLNMRLDTMMALHVYWKSRENIPLADYFLDEIVMISFSIRKQELIFKLLRWLKKIIFSKFISFVLGKPKQSKKYGKRQA